MDYTRSHDGKVAVPAGGPLQVLPSNKGGYAVFGQVQAGHWLELTAPVPSVAEASAQLDELIDGPRIGKPATKMPPQAEDTA